MLNLRSLTVEPFGSSCLDFAWSNLKEDCIIDRGNLLEEDLVLDLDLAFCCPNLIDCGGLYSC
jgi:hypothetical protein